MKASGRGLSAGGHAVKERAEQMKVAEDFARIMDNEDDVMLEAEEANNPSMYIPNVKDKHGAPRKKKGLGRGRGGVKKAENNPKKKPGRKPGREKKEENRRS